MILTQERLPEKTQQRRSRNRLNKLVYDKSAISNQWVKQHFSNKEF